MSKDSYYDDPEAIKTMVAAGMHREAIGGWWDEIGRLQFGFLKSVGLSPDHFLLDVGCGSLRGGVHFVRYLNPGHYYGIDINESLLDAGYEKEIEPAGLSDKLPRANLACVADFDASGFDRRFHFALAQSVFTHVSFNRIRLCLENLARSVMPGGVFYATYFALPEGHLSGEPLKHEPGEVTTYGYRDPYHYSLEDFRYAARNLPWRVEAIGEWGHPRGQKMLAFRRV